MQDAGEVGMYNRKSGILGASENDRSTRRLGTARSSAHNRSGGASIRQRGKMQRRGRISSLCVREPSHLGHDVFLRDKHPFSTAKDRPGPI